MAPRLVLINARAAARPELGGVERWARELSSRLPLHGDAALRYQPARPPAHLVHRAGHAWEQGLLPVQARRARAAALVGPANLAPVAFPRNVVVVHDAAALRQPDWYSRTYVAWQRAVLPALVRRALHVVTVSQFSRTELVELLGADPDRISVIPGGVDERFHPGARGAAADRDRPYVLTVASRTARKNLGALAETARRLTAEGIELLVVGGDRPQFRAEAADGLTWLGHVADQDLPALYAGARAFVLPSHYEGFGLTVLEALATGTPVVTSDRTALPELVGDAGLLVDPDDPHAIAEAVLSALDDPALRAAGPRRAAAYSWSRTAQEVDALIRRVAL